MFYLIPFFLICTQVFSFDADPFLPSSPPERQFSTSSDEYLIGGLVNPASGQISLSATDLVAMGAEPLDLTRSYYPPEIKESFNNKTDEDQYELFDALRAGSGWIFFSHLVATFQHIDGSIGSAIITISEPDGSRLNFKRKKYGKKFILEETRPFTNSNGQAISSTFDSRNTFCDYDDKEITIHSKDGSVRYYSSIKLEETPYLQGTPPLYYLKKERLPNGKIIVYSYKDKQRLTSIESKDPHEEHTYSKITRTSAIEWITHTGQKVNYQFKHMSAKGSYFSLKKLGYFPYEIKLGILSAAISPLSKDLYHYDSRGILCQQSNKNPVFSLSHAPYKEIERISELKLPISESDEILPTHKIKYHSYENEDGKIKWHKTTVTNPDETKTVYTFNRKYFLTNVQHEQKETRYFWNKETNYLTAIEVAGLYRKEFIADDYGNAKLETFIDLKSDERYQIQREYHKNLLLKEETDSGLTTHYTYLEGTNLVTSKIIDGNDGLHLEEHYSYDNYNNLIETIINNRITRYTLRQSHPHLHMIDWIEKEDRKIQLHYDEHANVIQEDLYDADGEFVYSIHKEYNERGQVTSETNPIGQKFTYTYNIDGHLTSSSKPKQTMDYDRRGRLISSSDALYTTTYKYDGSDNLVEQHNRFGSICCNYKDKKLIKALHGDKVTASSYDIYGGEISRTNANGQTTYFRYNARNQPIEVTHLDSTKEHFRYYINGNLKCHTDVDGNTITYIYDTFNRIISKNYESIGKETFVYDSVNLLSHTDLEGYTTNYFYDDLDHKIKEEKCGRVTEFTYDSLSRLASTIKGGITTEFKYDLLDQVIEESTPYSLITYTYDEDGNKSSITSGDTTEAFEYDPLKRLIKQTDPLGNVTTIEYTDFQKITTDPNGTSTTETYDIHEKLISKEIPNVTAFRYSYDPEGNLIQEEEDVYKNGNYIKTLTSGYTYTSNNKLSSITKSGETTYYTYTPSGRVQTKTKPNGTLLNYTYNSLGCLTSVASDTFSYNKLGHLIEGTGFKRELDPFGNILKETFSNGLTIEKTYDDLDRPITITLPTGTINYSYDLRLKTISYKGYTHTYSYNLAGHILRSGFTAYTRDSKGQITKLKAPHISQGCTYDALGNLIFATPDSYAYDELSQMAGEFDSHFDPPNAPETGNIIEHKGFHFTYDTQDRLIKANSIEFTYDALGRRLSKNNETYLYDGLTEIGTFKDGHFYLKINNALLDFDGTLAIPLFDATHTLRYLIDPNTHKILNSYEFDPFGNPLNIYEPLFNPYRYALKHYDPETELIYFGKRYYDPSTKRWITPDPAGPVDLINLYTFVRNNPFRYTDYTGLFSVTLTPTSFNFEQYNAYSSFEKLPPPPKFSSLYQVGTKELQCGGIGFTNGIFNNLEQAREHALLLSNYAGGYKIDGFHNQTHGFLDLLEHGASVELWPSPPSFMLAEDMNNFHKTKPHHEKKLMISTSGGTIQLKKALEMVSEDVQNRVIALNISPAAIITKKICYASYSYASRGDLVVLRAIAADPLNAHEITFLEPHPNSNPHSISSSTFELPLKTHINDYLNQYGGKR